MFWGAWGHQETWRVLTTSHLELYEGRMLNGADWAQGVSLGCGLVYLGEVIFPMALKGPGRGSRGFLLLQIKEHRGWRKEQSCIPDQVTREVMPTWRVLEGPECPKTHAHSSC